MILRIKQFFEKHCQTINNEDDIEHRLKLAATALLVEMMHVDHDINTQEESRLRGIMQTQFELDTAEIDDVLELASEKKHAAADYYQFTSLINQHYTQEQKIRLVEQLWQLAWADQHIDKFEEHLVRTLADLLHVPHRDFIQAKHRVLDTE